MPAKSLFSKSQGWLIASLLSLSVIALPVIYLYRQSEAVIYYKYGKAYWQSSHPATCDEIRQSYFADLRTKAVNAKNGLQALELTCAEALKLPAQSDLAVTADGLKIHYRRFTQTQAETKPILLHVSGITSDWLNGARYVPAAQRLGFELVAMEMRNHGNSDNDGKGVAYGCQEDQDVLAVLRKLASAQPQRQVYLWASSGATMAVLNASADLNQIPQLRAIVLENPLSSLNDIAHVKKPGLPEPVYDLAIGIAGWRAGQNFSQCAPVKQAADLHKPVLITVSQRDQLTPEWMAQKVLTALPKIHKQMKRYPAGEHERIWNGQPDVYEADLLAFWRAANP